MKIILTTAAIGLLAVSSALAADLPARIYTKASEIVPPSTWTGWYVGLNAGGGWGSNSIDDPVTSSFCTVNVGGCPPLGGTAPGYGVATTQAIPGTLNTRPSGFVGGGQFGYNYQAGQAVWGFESDFQWANIKGNASASNTTVARNDIAPTEFVTVAGAGSQKLDLFGTLRGRLGWTPSSPWLFYVTGGLAYGHVTSSASFAETGSVGSIVNSTSVASNTSWRAGWTAGAGAEWMIAQHWSLKGEYLYYDLGSVTLNNALGVNFFGASIASKAHYNGNIARVGVNYHF